MMIKNEIGIKEVCEYLKEHNNYIILTHSSPDGDCLGSGYALVMILNSLGKKARVVCPDAIPQKFMFFATKEEEFEYDTVISVDLADEQLLTNLIEVYGGKTELCIDHHKSNSHYAKYVYLDTEAAAVCECIYEIANELGVEITLPIARALYTGIATDTGCFKFSNTTPRTHLIAAKLLEIGVEAADINRVMFDTKSKARLEIEKMALQNADYLFDGKAVSLCVSMDMIKESGCTDEDLDGLSVIARSVEGISVAATMREKKPNFYKVSLRTFDGIDASAICGSFGGGGHKAAAGCVISGTEIEAKEKLYAAIKNALEDN